MTARGAALAVCSRWWPSSVVVVGLALPLVGNLWIAASQYASLSPSALLRAQRSEPLLWLLDLVGLALGLLAAREARRRRQRLANEPSSHGLNENEPLHRAQVLEAAVDQATDGILVVNRKGLIRYANPAWKLMHGFEKHRITDKSYEEAHGIDATNPDEQRFLRRIQRKGKHIQELSHRGPHGQQVLLLASGAELIGADARPIGTVIVARDISQQKRLEAELKMSTERAELYLSTMPAGLFAVDIQGRITQWNRRAEEITGYRSDEVMGHSCMKFALDPCLSNCGLMDETVPKPLYARRCTIRTRDGAVRTISKNVIELRNDQGERVGGLESFEDITAQVQAEEDLAAERDQAQRYLRMAGAVLVALDDQGRVTMINAEGERVLGYARDELLGQDWFTRCLPLAHRERTRAVFDQLMRGEEEAAEHHENPVLTRNGEERIISWHNQIFADTQGGGTGLFSAGVDVTEQRLTEEKLHRSERMLAGMFTGMQEGVLYVDAGGIVREANPYFCDFAGVARDDVRGQPLGALEILQQMQSLDEIKARFVEGDRTVLEQEREIAGRMIRFRLQPLVVDGDFGGVVYNLHDVTADHAARRLAEDSSRAKSAFLANMSHEIRTPLNGVVGMLDLLEATSLSGAQESHARTIRSSANALSAVLNDVLDFSKIEAGMLELTQIDFDLHDLLESVVDVVRPLAERKGLELIKLTRPNLPRWGHGDPDRLRQVLLNLATNAVKFTEDGHVLIDMRLEHVDDSGFVVRGTVDDTGVGIPEEFRERLFDSFSQADGYAGSGIGGTGLGLAICLQLTKLMGGEIGVSSTQGNGSIFWFTVHLTEATAEGAPQSYDPVDLSGLRVLVVDDLPVNRQVATAMLEQLGCQVIVAKNGREGLETVRDQPVDMVLMDVRMPEMDGLAATRAIREWENHKGRVPIPIVACTAHATAQDRQDCLLSGMDEYVTKPLRVRSLQEALGRLDPARRGEPSDAPAPEQQTQALHLVDSQAEPNDHRPPVGFEPEDETAMFDDLVTVNLDQLLEQIGQDEEILHELIEIFRADSLRNLQELRQALECTDAEGVRGAAHALKGTAAAFGADEVVGRARHLEELGRSGQLDAALPHIESLEEATHRLNEILNARLAS